MIFLITFCFLTPPPPHDTNHSRERNRMHAKMTRDRKKNFISTIEKTIADLERDNKRMRMTLEKQANHQISKGNTPNPSPLIGATPSPNTPIAVPPKLTLPAQVSANNSPALSPSPTASKKCVPMISVKKLTAVLAPPRKISDSSYPAAHGFNVIG